MANESILPSRLHHTAYVSRDLEATRKFYEDIIGLPLLATWCEKDMLFGAERTYCALLLRACATAAHWRFFQFAEPDDQELVRAQDAVLAVPSHCAQRRQAETQDGIEKRSRTPVPRSRSRSCSNTATAARCTSTDPNGMIVEFTHDHPDAEQINEAALGRAHRAQALARRRSHIEQHVSLMRICQHRPHPHHACRQPAALAGRHRRAVRA